MSGGLVIRLRPHEKFLINGAVVENGDKRAKLRVKSRDANILRLRDALHPNDATTPVKRIYYAAQLVVTGDADPHASLPDILSGLNALYEVLPGDDIRQHITEAISHAQEYEFYHVMRMLKKVIPFEDQLLLFARAKELSQAGKEAR